VIEFMELRGPDRGPLPAHQQLDTGGLLSLCGVGKSSRLRHSRPAVNDQGLLLLALEYDSGVFVEESQVLCRYVLLLGDVTAYPEDERQRCTDITSVRLKVE
jgi:hypothetical protein